MQRHRRCNLQFIDDHCNQPRLHRIGSIIGRQFQQFIRDLAQQGGSLQDAAMIDRLAQNFRIDINRVHIQMTADLE